MDTAIEVLVVDDNQDLRDSVIEYLAMTGLAATGAANAAECYQALSSGNWSVAVVDIGLPDQSGFVLVEYLRANTDTKVIILSARDSVDDRVKGYDCGADLYLVKPVDCRELTAAVFSLAQRQLTRAEADCLPRSQAESWSINQNAWSLTAPNGVSIALTAKEMQFLVLLADTPGTPVNRETLLAKLYLRHDEYTSRSLDALVRRLRGKIVETSRCDSPIKTAHSVGYCFSSPLIIV